MLLYLIIHVLCGIGAWYAVMHNMPATDLGLPLVGCIAAVLCFLFGPVALIVVILSKGLTNGF